MSGHKRSATGSGISATLIMAGASLLAGIAALIIIDPPQPPKEVGAPPKSSSELHLQQFQTLYEPSGSQQLPDGRIIVIEDEKTAPFSILSFESGGATTTHLQTASLLEMAKGTPGPMALRDLEGIDIDNDGYVYAITSFSKTAEGKRAKNARERLIRFRIEGDRLVDFREIPKLRRVLKATDSRLKKAAKVSDVKNDNGFNIEGLAFNRAKDQLMIGFRSPVIDDRAVIMVLKNPTAAFESGATPVFDEHPVYLDLDKGGIRAITYDPKLGGYLIISRRENKSGKRFKLWLWDGEPDSAPRRLRFSEKLKITNAEGITPIRINGTDRLLVVFDDGNRAKREGAHYLVLDYETLVFSPAPDPGASD